MKELQGFFPRGEYEQRWTKVDEAIRALELDAALVWGRSGGTYERHGDVLYLANYYSNQSGQVWDRLHEDINGGAMSCVVLRPGQTPELVADEPWPRQHLIPTDRIAWSFDPFAETLRSLKTNGPMRGRVGIAGSDFVGFKYWEQLKTATPGIEWVVCDELVSDVRIIKSARELEAFRIAGETVTEALDTVIKALRSGKSEAEAAGEGAREVFRRGGQPHMIPISSGDNISYFVSRPVPGFGPYQPKEGDLVRAWVYGPMFEGYWLDPGRTTVVGRPTNSQRHLVEATASLIEQCRAAIRPGVTVAEIVALGDRLQSEFGGIKDQAAEKWPLYGHGNGLFWDEPLLSHGYRGKHTVIQQNMVMSTETFMATEGVGSAGFEQNFIVTAEGTELLTNTPLLWWD